MNYYLLAGVVLATALAVAYLVASLLRKNAPQLPHVLSLILASFSVPASIKLGYLGLTTEAPELAPFTDEDRVYVLAGAIALLWISVASIIQTLRS